MPKLRDEVREELDFGALITSLAKKRWLGRTGRTLANLILALYINGHLNRETAAHLLKQLKGGK